VEFLESCAVFRKDGRNELKILSVETLSSKIPLSGPCLEVNGRVRARRIGSGKVKLLPNGYRDNSSNSERAVMQKAIERKMTIVRVAHAFEIEWEIMNVQLQSAAIQGSSKIERDLFKKKSILWSTLSARGCVTNRLRYLKHC
jgi:hypothetical protein